MKQDENYKKYYLVYFQESEISQYGRVISNHSEYLELDISDRCRSCICRIPWDEIEDIRLAQEFELEDL